MQAASIYHNSLQPPIGIKELICCCPKSAITTIAAIILTAVVVTSALILANVITLLISAPLLIIAIAISALALGRLCCYIHKNLHSVPSIPLSGTPVSQQLIIKDPQNLNTPSIPISTPPISEQELTADDPLSDVERTMLKGNSTCKCEGCTFKPGNILNQDEQLVLRAWSVFFFQPMNNVMSKQYDNPHIKHINQIAIKALSKLPLASDQQSLIRGANFQVHEVQQVYPVGQKIILDRFMSTTTASENDLPGEALYKNTRFYIQGITGKSIKFYACRSFAAEEEVLFAPGTQFLTTKIILDTYPKQVFLQEVVPDASL